MVMLQQIVLRFEMREAMRDAGKYEGSKLGSMIEKDNEKVYYMGQVYKKIEAHCRRA